MKTLYKYSLVNPTHLKSKNSISVFYSFFLNLNSLLCPVLLMFNHRSILIELLIYSDLYINYILYD